MVESKRSTLRRALRFVGLYGGVFFLTLAATVYWTFPYELVTDRLVSEIERGLGVDLEITSVSPYRGLGLRASDVAVSMNQEGPHDDERSVKIDALTVRLRLLQTITSGPAFSFAVNGELGNLRGRASRNRNENIGIDMELDALSLGKVPGLAESLGVGLLGDVSGTVDITLPEGRTEDLSGVIDLRIAESGIGGGMIRGATIPPVDMGQIQPRIVAEEGTLRFEPALEVSSEDLNAHVEGTLRLRGNLATSRADLTLRFRPTDRFWDANQMLAGLARAMMSNAEQQDGFYAYRLTGAIGRPQFQPVR